VAVRRLTAPQERRLLAENHLSPPAGSRAGKGNPRKGGPSARQ
jgi:hypothetical protein